LANTRKHKIKINYSNYLTHCYYVARVVAKIKAYILLQDATQ